MVTPERRATKQGQEMQKLLEDAILEHGSGRALCCSYNAVAVPRGKRRLHESVLSKMRRSGERVHAGFVHWLLERQLLKESWGTVTEADMPSPLWMMSLVELVRDIGQQQGPERTERQRQAFALFNHLEWLYKLTDRQLEPEEAIALARLPMLRAAVLRSQCLTAAESVEERATEVQRAREIYNLSEQALEVATRYRVDKLMSLYHTNALTAERELSAILLDRNDYHKKINEKFIPEQINAISNAKSDCDLEHAYKHIIRMAWIARRIEILEKYCNLITCDGFMNRTSNQNKALFSAWVSGDDDFEDFALASKFLEKGKMK